MNNILFFLTPKAMCAFLYDDYTIRQAMEKMKKAAFEKAKNTQLSITVPDEITVGELASRLKVNSGEIIKKLMMMGVFATVNDVIDYDTAALVAMEFHAKVEKTFVNGHLVYQEGKVDENYRGQALTFDRI